MQKIPLSVTIITHNEEKNLRKAIESVSFAAEIIVVDSLSSDSTFELAASLGAKVFSQDFLGYGQQKNFAASKAKNNWILNIDADEEVSIELQKSLIELFNSKSIHTSDTYLYQFKRLNHYLGKSIHYGGWYPDLKKRLYHRDYVVWSTPEVHEDLVYKSTSSISIKVPILTGNLNHYSFHSIESQVLTNLRYAKLGAIELKKKQGKPNWMNIFFRPFIKFVECYMVKRGFLDGSMGFIIAINAAYSIFLKNIFAKFEKKTDE